MKKIIFVIACLVFFVIGLVVLTLLLCPQKLKQEISKYSSEYNIDASVVASVINIESGYDACSVSKAGAIGVMQLLPSTAFDCAKRIGISIDEEDLFKEEINIKLGCYYLRYLLDLFDGNWTNTLCAYNWGYGNVCNWIALGNVDQNGTVTNLPVLETRNYIKKFKVNMFIYEKVYKYRNV